MSSFCTEEQEKERMAYFGSAEGLDDVAAYSTQEGRGVVEVLRDFATCKPPIEWLLSCAPVLRNREFSIASAQSAHGS